MTKTEARRLLRKVEEHFREWRTVKCSRFVFGPLRSAIRSLDQPRSSRSDRSLAGTGHAFTGDIFDFIDAPRAAARAYRAAVRCDPGDAWSWRELGSALDQMGQYRVALRAFRKAQALEPEDDLCTMRIEMTTDAIRDGDAPRYEDGRDAYRPAPSWDACELLARDQPRQALRLLRGKRHRYLRQLRTRAQAALGDMERFVEEWKGIARTTTGEICIECADWFFLPDEARDTAGLWRAFYRVRDRLGYGWTYMHEALDRIVPDPARRRATGRDLQRHRRRSALWFRYEIARTEKDARKAARLATRYPDWPEAVRLAKRLR